MNGKLFDPYMVTLETLFGNNYTIPVYQRPYSWGKEEVEDLYTDLINNYESHNPGTYEGVFTGTIYLKNDGKLYGKYDKCMVIDGQQRITTFTLMFLAVYGLAKERNLKDLKEIVKIRDFLWRYVNKDYQKEARLLELGNIDKDLMKQLFDVAYGDTNNLKKYVDSFDKVTSNCEKCLINNLKYFWENLDKKFDNSDSGNDKLIDFVDYVLESTQFVLIYVNTPMKQVFEIFESINSKGKKLQEIDLIKSYIFQEIAEKDHAEYLDKWGQLITKTNDELEDYLYIFIRAYIKYYKVSLSVKYFKTLCKNELKVFYNAKSIEEALKNLIDDMISRVECYNMLLNESALPNKLKTAQFLFFYNSMIYLGYQHPRALMFKALCQYKETKINDIAIKSIVRNSLVFMITFQTINNRDSKDAIPVFEKIMTDDYGVDSLDITKIKTTFSNRLATEGITEDSLHTRIKEYKGYAKQDKSETIVLLAFYESLTDGKVSYDNANIIIKNRLMFAIDHILPQHPDEKNIDFKYYCGKNKNDEDVLVLKTGSDFPKDITDGMDYNLFKEQILHKLGNLRIMLSSKNGAKSNLTVNLGNYGDFNTYEKVEKRAEDIAKALFQSELLKIV